MSGVKARSASRLALAFLAAVAAAYVLASVSQSFFIMAALESVGAEFPMAMRLHVIAHDLIGLVAYGEIPYGGCILLGFLIALPLAGVGVRASGLPGFVLYPLAGAGSIAAILAIIQAGFFYNMTFMEGTRGASGYAAQLAAGALGGLVFQLLSKGRAS